ncbi:MAG TPA: hypothetical protein VG676_15515 [Chitinophagaceae bacterium]|nr:hypothetical protein [Chitinophagaceae bacterium]
MTEQVPIPGYPDYTVTKEGNVFYKGQLKILIRKPGRSLKIRVQKNGVKKELGLAKLLAQLFLPNPGNHTRVIFKDGNKHNCSLDNIQWVSNTEFVRYNLFPGKPLYPQAKPRKRKTPVPLSPPSDPLAKEIPGHPSYYITPQGRVYHHNREIKLCNHSKKKALQVCLRQNKKSKYLGLAKLLATVFIPNPCNYTRMIFKDRNNKNCSLENIAWASGEEYKQYTESFKPDFIENIPEDDVDPARVPVPGYPGYYITPDGKVYLHNKLLRLLKYKTHRAARVKLRNGNTVFRPTVAKLVALAFIPNPENFTRVIFKDDNYDNCTKENLQWVSEEYWHRFVKKLEVDDILGPSKPKKIRVPDWIDPERVEMPDFPGYYVTPAGVVYYGDRIIKPFCKKGKAPLIRVRAWGKRRTLGLATLVAEHFVPNPRKYKRIIFKDRNNQNCSADNIAWVDMETYTYYCTGHKGKKLYVDRGEAIKKCTDDNLRMYYKTLDEYWLHECWNNIEKKICIPNWEEFRADSYLYFIDRAQRFSILKSPVGLVVMHLKTLKEKLRKEISPDMPLSVLRRTDDSLRNIKPGRKEHVEWYGF